MRNAYLDQIVHVVIHIFTVGIAPLAIFLVEKSIGFLADIAVFKRHPTALTDQALGRAEKRIDRYVKLL